MIIGNNTLLGTVAAYNLTQPKMLWGTGQEAVLTANQEIIAVHIGWSDGNGTGAGTVNIGLTDVGNGSANKPLIPGTTVSVPYDASTLSSGAQWISVTGLSIDISAHAGKTLCPQIAIPASSPSGFSVLLGTSTGANRSNHSSSQGTLADPFITGSTSANQAWSVYIETATIAPSDSITPPATITDGSTVTVSNTGFASGAPNDGTIGGQTAIVVGTSVTLPDSDLVADGTVVSPIGSQTIELTNGTESASNTTTVALKAGYTRVTMATVDTVTSNGMYQLLQTVGKTVQTGDVFQFTNTDGSSMTDDGLYDWYNLPKSFTYIDSASKAWQYRLTVAGTIESSTSAIVSAIQDAIQNSIKGL